MRTPDMSDEELDQLFRRGADAYPDKVSLSGWLRLSEQLDEAAQQQRLRRQVLRRVAGLFALEMGLVALLFIFWQFPSRLPLRPSAPLSGQVATQPNRPTSSPDSTLPGNGTTRGTSSSSGPNPSVLSAPTAPFATTLPSQQTTTAATTSRPQRAPASLSVAVATPITSGVTRALSKSIPGVAVRPIVRASTAAELPTADHQQPAAASAVSLSESSTTTAPEAFGQPVEQAAASTPIHPTDSLARTFAPDSVAQASISTADSVVAVAPVRSELPSYRLLVGVVGGPELTAVLPGPGARLGGTFGLTAEYRLSSRWRIRTGVLRSVKRYAARGSDYNPPPTYWTWRIPIEQVDANCRIVEIPLDVRYEVISRPTYSLYASAGLTSLLMRNERYSYHYDINGQYVNRTWSLSKGSNAALRVVNLSAGLEHTLSGRWTMQTEPFLKLPLSGVGFGKIRLNSAGVLLGVKYGLVRPRTAP
ncbi:porin family protein [Hymenobacter tenuis]